MSSGGEIQDTYINNTAINTHTQRYRRTERERENEMDDMERREGEKGIVREWW